MDKFILVAYKSDSSDYCRGCHMASYSSDFVYREYEEGIDKLVGDIAKLYAMDFEHGEDGYLIWIIHNGETILGDFYIRGSDTKDKLLNHCMSIEPSEESILSEIDARLEVGVKAELERKRKEKEEKEIEQRSKDKKAREEDEKRRLRELAKKYPNEVK